MTGCRTYYFLRFSYVLSVSFTKTSFIPYLLWRGLSSYEVHLVYAIFNIAVLLFEVPVSGIGERIGPARSFWIGCLCKCASAALFFVGGRVWHFYLAEIVSALGIAFISGSLNAWLMDRLNESSDRGEKESSRVFMLGNRISKVALALGGCTGAYVAHLHLGYPWFLVCLGFGCTFYLAWKLLRGDGFRNAWKMGKAATRWDWENLTCGYRTAVGNKVLLVLLIHGFLLNFALASPKMFWLPYLKTYFQKDMIFLGHMWLCLAALQFLGTFGLSALLGSAGSALRLKFFFTSFSVLTLFGLIVFRENIVCFIALYLLLEWAQPYHQALDLTMIHAETSHGRITFLSLNHLVESLGYTLGLIAVGWISECSGIFYGWLAGGCLYALSAVCYWRLLGVSRKVAACTAK